MLECLGETLPTNKGKVVALYEMELKIYEHEWLCECTHIVTPHLLVRKEYLHMMCKDNGR